MQTSTSVSRHRYDGLTILLHWLTALCVIFLFASAHIWEVLERGTPLRKGLQSVHISVGILLAAIILGRLLWRLFTVSTGRSKQEPVAMPVMMKAAAHLTHLALYIFAGHADRAGLFVPLVSGRAFLLLRAFPHS